MKYKLSERCWGGEDDLAQDLEDLYEETTGQSAVYWEPVDRTYDGPFDLEGRNSLGDRYVTCGYTSEFEGWGQRGCDMACEEGCESPEDVYDWFVHAFGKNVNSNRFKWVCECDGEHFEDSYEDFGCTFATQEDCYENMRRHAVNKILWNTDWNDVIEDCCSYDEDGLVKTSGEMKKSGKEEGDNWSVGYRIEFHPHMIQHYSYSGLYTYNIVKMED